LDHGFIALSASGDVQAFNVAYATLAVVQATAALGNITLPKAFGAAGEGPLEVNFRGEDGLQLVVCADIISISENCQEAFFALQILNNETIPRFNILTDRSGIGMWLTRSRG